MDEDVGATVRASAVGGVYAMLRTRLRAVDEDGLRKRTETKIEPNE